MALTTIYEGHRSKRREKTVFVYKRWWLWAIVAWSVWGIYVQIDMNGSTLTENNMEHMMGSGIILVIVVVVIYRLFKG